MVLIALAGLLVGVVALVVLVTLGLAREFWQWQNHLIFHRWRPGH